MNGRRPPIRSFLAIILALAIVAMGGCRIYRQSIPAGAEFFPYWLASDPGPILTSPDGRLIVHVVFNDAGAMHSGNHWTWLVVEDWLMGKRVVAQGYSTGHVPFRARWLDDRTLEVDFVEGRYKERPVTAVVRFR